MNRCVCFVAGTYDFIQGSLVCNHYQSTGLAFRHSSAGFGDFLDSLAGMKALCSLSENPVKNLATLCVAHVSVSKSDEEFSDFGLEYHDQCNHSHIKHCVQKRSHELHVEGRHKDAYEVKGYDGDEDAHSGRPPYPFEENEDKKCQKQYVQDVCERHLKKSENSQIHNCTINHANILII